MQHSEFLTSYQAGRLRLDVDRTRAAKLLSARMLLPVFLLPMLGVSVALALIGHWIAGLLLFVAAFAFRQLVRNSAPAFVAKRALADAAFYNTALSLRVITLVPVPPTDAPPPDVSLLNP